LSPGSSVEIYNAVRVETRAGLTQIPRGKRKPRVWGFPTAINLRNR